MFPCAHSTGDSLSLHETPMEESTEQTPSTDGADDNTQTTLHLGGANDSSQDASVMRAEFAQIEFQEGGDSERHRASSTSSAEQHAPSTSTEQESGSGRSVRPSSEDSLHGSTQRGAGGGSSRRCGEMATPQSRPGGSKRRTPDLSPFQSQVLEAYSKRKRLANAADEEEEAFATLILASLRRIPENQRFQTKMRVLTMLHDAETLPEPTE